MARTGDEIRENRRRLKARYGKLFDAVATLLFQKDPIGINFEENTDEYESEAETILPRLRTCKGPDDVLEVVYAEFVRWFDADTAGPRERYVEIASEIWQLWQRYLSEGMQSDWRAH